MRESLDQGNAVTNLRQFRGRPVDQPGALIDPVVDVMRGPRQNVGHGRSVPDVMSAEKGRRVSVRIAAGAIRFIRNYH